MNARSNRPPHRCIGLHHIVEGLQWRANQALHSLPIEWRELKLDLSVINQDEPPLLVYIWRANGSIEDASLHVVGDRVRFQPPHRAGRVQRFVDIHEVPPCCLMSAFALLVQSQSTACHWSLCANVITTFPFLCPLSTYLWASAICSNG